MEKKAVNVFHQSIEVAVWLITHPQKHVVDRLLETVFEL
jgi:transcriptional regulator